MNANALTQRIGQHGSAKHLIKEVPGSQAVAGTTPGVVESPGDQSWTDFCGSLNTNALLLPVTGFGDLE